MIDLSLLRDYLVMKRAPPLLVAWIHAELDAGTTGSGFEALPELAYEDCALLLAGVLELSVPVDKPLDQSSVQRFLQLCEQLGFDDTWIDAFVRQRIRVSLEVLTALAWLKLPLSPSQQEVTAAHRSMAKLYHPDRVTQLADEIQDLARLRTTQLNRAKEALLQHLASPPPFVRDVFIDPDWEDAPTDVEGDGVTEALEILED